MRLVLLAHHPGLPELRAYPAMPYDKDVVRVPDWVNAILDALTGTIGCPPQSTVRRVLAWAQCQANPEEAVRALLMVIDVKYSRPTTGGTRLFDIVNEYLDAQGAA